MSRCAALQMYSRPVTWRPGVLPLPSKRSTDIQAALSGQQPGVATTLACSPPSLPLRCAILSLRSVAQCRYGVLGHVAALTVAVLQSATRPCAQPVSTIQCDLAVVPCCAVGPSARLRRQPRQQPWLPPYPSPHSAAHYLQTVYINCRCHAVVRASIWAVDDTTRAPPQPRPPRPRGDSRQGCARHPPCAAQRLPRPRPPVPHDLRSACTRGWAHADS